MGTVGFTSRGAERWSAVRSVFGRVAERLKAHDWKSCGLIPAWVRIPPRPFWKRWVRAIPPRPFGSTIVSCMVSPHAFPRERFLGGNVRIRGVAQFGRALRSGRRGPRFKSGRPDSNEVTKRAGARICGLATASTRRPPKADARTVGSAEAQTCDPRMWSGRRRRDERGGPLGPPQLKFGRGRNFQLRPTMFETRVRRPRSRRIIGIAPVSKTGAREGVWVRIPPAPLVPSRSSTWGAFSSSERG